MDSNDTLVWMTDPYLLLTLKYPQSDITDIRWNVILRPCTKLRLIYLNSVYDSYESRIELYYLRYTHTVEEINNSVVHRGNRGVPRAVHKQQTHRNYEYKRNIEALLRNHCCRWKAKIFKLSEYASVAHAPCHSVISGLSGSTIFSTLSSTKFGRKLLNVKCVFGCFYSFCS